MEPNSYKQIDGTAVRVGAKEDADTVSIALQGVDETWGGVVPRITVTCSTYEGTGYDASITAVQIPE
jgi:hypothetical protein